MDVEVGRTRLKVSGSDGNRVFIHPAFRGDVDTLRASIASERLGFPNMGDWGVLFHDSYVKDRENPYSKEIGNLMDFGIAYGDTATLWTEKGLLGYDGAVSEGLNLVEMADELVDLLTREERGVRFSEDGKIRFTLHKNIRLDIQTLKDFAVNRGLVVCVGGFEEAEKYSKVAEKFNYLPYFGGLTKDKLAGKLIQKVVGAYSWLGSWLGVSGSCYGYDARGFAFGVDRSAEGTRV